MGNTPTDKLHYSNPLLSMVTVLLTTFPLFLFCFKFCPESRGRINSIFNFYPIIQEVLIGTGTIFLIYLAYKISFSKSSTDNKELKPVNFIETFLFQFLNPKGVIVAIVAVSTYTESGINFLNYSMWMLSVAFMFAIISIIFWTLLGKFMRKFATNEKFIKLFNYVMSTLLLFCIATFYY